MKYISIIILFLSFSSKLLSNVLSYNADNIFKIKAGEQLKFKMHMYDDLMILIENKGIDSFAKITNNGQSLISASWMGSEGSYVLLKHSLDKKAILTVSTIETIGSNGEINIKIFKINKNQTSIKNSINNLTLASNYRLKHYFGGQNNNIKAAYLFNKSETNLKGYLNGKLSAIAAYEAGVIYYELEKYDKANESFERAFANWERLKNFKSAISSLNRKGLALLNQEKFFLAQKAFTRVLLKSTSHSFTEEISNSLNNLGLINLQQKHFKNAIKYFSKSLDSISFNFNALFKETDAAFDYITNNHNVVNIAPTISNLAMANDGLGNASKAEKLWLLYSKISEHLSNTLTTGIAQNNLGVLMMDKGEFDVSLISLKKAKKAFEQKNNNKWLSLAEHNLGQLYIELGQYELAVIQFNKALGLRTIENNPKGRIESLLKLSGINIKRKQFDDAEVLLNEAKQIAEKTDNKQAQVLAAYQRHQMAMLNEQHDAAMAFIDQALHLATGQSYQRLISRLKVAKAHVHVKQQEPQSAISLLTHEVSTIEQVWDVNLLNQARNLLAISLHKNHQTEQAIEVIRQEIKHLNQLMTISNNHSIISTVNANLRNTFNILAVISSGHKQNRSVLSDLNQHILNAQYISSTKQLNSSNNKDSLLEQLSNKSYALENIHLSESDRDAIKNELLELKSSLEFQYKTNALENPYTFDLAKLQQQLPADTVVVQYAIGEFGGVSWWVSKDQTADFILPNQQELLELIQLSRNEIMGEVKGFKNTKRLSNTLLSPIKSYPGIKNLILVPDTPLHLIPFSALGDPIADFTQPLNKRVTIELKSSNRLFNDNSLKPFSKTSNVLVVADPVTDIEDQRINKNQSINNSFQNFNRLQGTSIEANQIQQLTSTETLLGFDANKLKILNSNFNKLDTLHFATHAFFNAQSPDLSALVLSAYNQSGGRQAAYLRAYEIRNMALRNLDLVVLSGCETGVEGINDAYGFGGLSQAFLNAGVKQLVASLWKVDDTITSQLMTAFYQQLTEGHSASKALYMAQQSLQKYPRTSHPKYWSGWFIISQ